MFAVMEIGGKQYLVKPKDTLRLERIDLDDGKEMSVDKVLLVGGEGKTAVGAPYVNGSSVQIKMLGSGKSDKVRTFKMKAKKRYKRLKGHRQQFSDVEVLGINV